MTKASFQTHEVFNQSPPFWDVDLYAVDRPLVEAVAANGGAAIGRDRLDQRTIDGEEIDIAERR